ncbi:MAG TPA: magnesium transporter [bacterium]|nr:magnesium transporter [bacterium]
MKSDARKSERRIVELAHKDYCTLRHDETVGQALDSIRARGLGKQIAYFYVVDEKDALSGVIPTRLLLTEPLERPLSKIMIKNIVTIDKDAAALKACELFAAHKFLSIPVVDEQKRIVGVVDVSTFANSELDINNQKHMNELFEAIGFRVSELREASALKAFCFRFPWLLSTIAGGTICALLAGVFEATLEQSLALAFFLTLILGLGESVSIQTMTVTIQSLHAANPTLKWYLRQLLREIGSVFLLGAACGAIVGAFVFLWLKTETVTKIISVSIVMTLCMAAFYGLSVPSLLHKMKLDLKIAAGPVTLALTDITTLLCYFSVAAWLL